MKKFSSDAEFRISYPRAWKIDSTTDASLPVKLSIYVTPSNVVDAVSVATSDLERGATLEDFTNSNLEGLTNLEGYTLISSEDISFVNRPACKVVWQATVHVQLSEAAVQEMQIKAMQIFVISNDTGYAITYKATPKDFNKYLPQAQEVIDSFEFA